MLSKARRPIYVAGLLTLVGMGGIGVLLILLVHRIPWQALFPDNLQDWAVQLGIGIVYGWLSSMLMLLLLRRRVMDAARTVFSNLMLRFKMRTIDIVFISLCAGIGEELLFRGGIQPWIGVWATAFVFIALHGYLDLKDRPVLVYGLFMVVVCAGFGYLMRFFGILTAITAHSVIDILLMKYLKKPTYIDQND
ncbi:MAG TPA: hypothetical protein DHW15_08045 [Bacteroidetes bacterium]|nr:MAG: hypothetical protein ABR94_07395 [Sphingobacteriales bacterium BACL12 MAG-120802-bin5]KRP13431.1 MAG: hypothetical protein ABR95_02595 [Sphingobacteriales bacterium BACL12 MAG-120813-bin55]HCK22095.1 hypothetical protein [Bacteroidota bacterium]